VSHPPHAPLAFRLGVVGHRPNRLAGADLALLEQRLGEIASHVKQKVAAFGQGDGGYAAGAPRLRALSPLAEGVDRVFADAVLAQGFELCCVMPFAEAELRKDFEPPRALEAGSLQRFEALLARARQETVLTRFELDGDRGDEAAAYAACTSVVVHQSDLLIAVWDGERQGLRGGVETGLEEARRQRVPVVLVDARQPHAARLLAAGEALPPYPLAAAGSAEQLLAALTRTVSEILALAPARLHHSGAQHGKEEDEDPARGLRRFYAERQHRVQLAFAWRWFRSLLSAGSHLPAAPPLPAELALAPASSAPAVPDAGTWKERRYERAVLDEWPADTSAALNAFADRLRPYYAWPDQLALFYSDRYRSAFVLVFSLAAFAVGMALFPLLAGFPSHGLGETLCTALELCAIATIVGLVVWGRRAHWHERWTDYRFAAELVRGLRMVSPLGGPRPFPRLPPHVEAYGRPEATWMAWYVRALERHAALPTLRLDAAQLEHAIAELAGFLRAQCVYHVRNAHRCELIEHRLQRTGATLFGLTLLACVLHLFPALHHAIPLVSQLSAGALTFFAGFFPALGASLAGIVNQGEFRRLHKRSVSMERQLAQRLARLGELRSAARAAQHVGPFAVELALQASEAARLVASEMLDWRVVVLDRPLEAA
jgi:hypothetical protein